MKRWYFFLIMFVFLIFPGCADKGLSIKNTNNFSENRQLIRRIAVLPFSGDVTFCDELSERFAMHLVNGLKNPGITIIPPSQVKALINEMKVGLIPDDDIQLGQSARRLAQRLQADALLVGTVRTNEIGAPSKGFVTVKLMDAKTGAWIFFSQRESGIGVELFGHSVYQGLMEATMKVKEDLVNTLHEPF